MEGQHKLILDGRLQYIWRVQHYQAGVFLEIYNLTNHANFGRSDRRAQFGQLHDSDRGRQPAARRSWGSD
jgi:hypothetical protein